MLSLLARIGMAIVGLVSGLMAGWLSASWFVERFALEYKPSTAGDVLPLIGLGIVGGSLVGLIAGILLPCLWTRYALTRRIKAFDLPATFLLEVVVLFPLLLLVHVGFSAASIEPIPIKWWHTLADALLQTLCIVTLLVLLKRLRLSKPAALEWPCQ